MTAWPSISGWMGPKPDRLLVFHVGNLGDTVVALPAFAAVRAAFPSSSITLLHPRFSDKTWVTADQVLDGTGYIDIFGSYCATGWGLLRAWALSKTLVWLRGQRFGLAIALLRSSTPPVRLLRVRRFLALAGIRRVIGASPAVRERIRNMTPRVPIHETDYLLHLLDEVGVSSAAQGEVVYDLHLGADEVSRAAAWLRSAGAMSGRPLIAIGPGSKMPSKVWAPDRFAQVGDALIREFGVVPIIFGGVDERELARSLVATWGRGVAVPGEMSVRGAAAVMTYCTCYIGCDTGAMHLAVAAGLRCVAVFSARDTPGKWYPYGPGHTVLRADVPCDGCMCVDCPVVGHPCMSRIAASDVLDAARRLLVRGLAVPRFHTGVNEGTFSEGNCE